MAFSTIPTAGLSTGGANFRNLIINGDMSIAQRGTSVSGLTNGSSQYLIDRFKWYEGGSPTYQFTMSQDTDVPTGQGLAKSLKLDCTTAQGSLGAGDQNILWQRIEGQNLQQLKYGTSSAESLTLSFWVKSSKTGTYIVELYQPDGTRGISKAYTISASNTWEKKTITYAGDTSGTINNDNGAGLDVYFFLSAGSNYQSGTLATSWQGYSAGDECVGQVNLADSTDNNWWITGVQLEVGTSASDFEFLPYDVNLRRCARYYQKVLDGSESTDPSFENFTSYNGAGVYSSHIYPMGEMRTTPSGVSSSTTDGFKFWSASTSHTSDSVSFDHINKRSAWIFTTMKSSTTQGNSLFSAANQTTTRCAFDAEL
jgi:hypothetical protein